MVSIIRVGWSNLIIELEVKEDNKRWLLSMMKTSGSKRRYLTNGSYADDRNTKQDLNIEDLPNHESIKNTQNFYNGKINSGLLVRFLRNKIGTNWDEVYSEIISRIPTKLLDRKEIIFWFVADKVEMINGKPWNKKSNKFIWTPEQGEYSFDLDHKEFYVNPETNILVKIADKPKNK
ncbi:MAG: hypothetical protein U0T69_10510 [Chitinophagales bacterium]